MDVICSYISKFSLDIIFIGITAFMTAISFIILVTCKTWINLGLAV